MRKSRILVIEDHEVTRKNLAAVLQQEGFDVVIAATGEEALSLLAERFDLVLTDLVLPQVQGSDIVAHIKKETPEIPVIVMTATGTEENWTAMQAGGATAFITKPFDLGLLVSCVRAALPQ
ncbi:MAG: response regulator [Candidatus Binatia bacterium]